MEDQFSDSSFEEANKLIHSAFNSSYAMNHAKNVAIRKQLLEAAVQKLLESKTFYISDVRDIAAMNNRTFDSRTKLYEQMNILNCREYRKMRPAVLELLPLMIHRATGIQEDRFVSLLDANRPAPDRTPAANPVNPASTADQAIAVPAAVQTPDAAASPAVDARSIKAAMPPAAQRGSHAGESLTMPAGRPLPLLLSLGLNMVLGAALLMAIQFVVPQEPVARSTVPAASPAGPIAPVSLPSPAAASPAYVVDSVIRTGTPGASLSQIAAALPVDKDRTQQYLIGVRIEKIAN